jgi:hypothetical protein
VCDRAYGQHDEGERGVGGVEALGAVHDHPDAPVERLVPRVVHAEPDGGQDAVAVLADGLGLSDEGFSPLRDAREQKRSRSSAT